MLQLKNLQPQIHSMIFLIKTTIVLKEKDIFELVLLYKDEQIYNFYTQTFWKGIPYALKSS